MKQFILLLYFVFMLTACGDHHDADHHDHEEHIHEDEHDHDHDHEENMQEDEHNHDHDGHEHEHNGNDHDHDGHEHDDESGQTSGGHNEIHFPEDEAKAIDLATTQLSRQTFHDVARCSGEILPAQSEEHKIVAKSGGVVIFKKSNLLSGRNIRSGEELFVISGGKIADGNIRQRYETAKTAFDKAKADFERARKLRDKKVISEKEFLNYKLEFERSKIDFQTLSASFSDNGVSIESPINGYVSRILVNEGEYVTAGRTLAVAAKNNLLTLRVDLDQSYFDLARNISGANIYLPYKNKYYDLEELKGRVVSVGKSIDNNATIPVYLELINNGDFLPGAYAEVALKGREQGECLVVPRAALIEQQGAYFVFTKTGRETYHKREVRPQASAGDEFRIEYGLAEGDQIVTRGAYRLLLASQTAALPSHGHVH
jgi:RND family efflux transporter MFP subunit